MYVCMYVLMNYMLGVGIDIDKYARCRYRYRQ